MNRQLFSRLLGIALLITSLSPASAQVATPPQATTPQSDGAVAARPRTTGNSGGFNEKYKIGVGDVLIIRVFGHAELTREMPVQSSGNIRMPFFGELQAACLTEPELANQIADKLRKYLKDPQVDVVVKEYRSQPVAVIGAVAQPGRFQLQRRVRLLELLTYAGGPGMNAGSSVFVIHNNDMASCDKALDAPSTFDTPGAETNAVLSTLKLKDLLAGSPEANLYVRPGDVVSIPIADQVFVTGGVVRPGALPLGVAMTLFTAISAAGGIGPEASSKNVRLIRQDPETGKRTETIHNLDDIEKRKAEDVTLIASDVINVQGSTVKSLKRSLMQLVPATVSALPLVILP